MTTHTPKDFVTAFPNYGSIKAVARAWGESFESVRTLYLKAVSDQLMEKLPIGGPRREKTVLKVPEPEPQGHLRAVETRQFSLPGEGSIKRYLFTTAQNNTKIHEQLWRNAIALAKHYDAEIHVSRCVYIKSNNQNVNDKALAYERHPHAKASLAASHHLTWDNRLTPYLSDERAEVAPGLVWCGEMNILPTASRPLSGLEVYTGRRSGIFPHVKLAMESVASARTDPTKFNYTTGAITMRNYIQRKAGLKAEFHHCYGFLLVEVNSKGDWFCRQLNADSEGTMHDLDLRVKNGRISKGHRVEAITWGDIHVADGSTEVAKLAWGENGMLDALKPKYQFFHDVIDFRGRSHHEIKDPHRMFQRWLSGQENVREEVQGIAYFLERAQRPWCQSIIVDSNHHHHLARWLKEQDGRHDPVNARFWLAVQDRIYAALSRNENPIYLKEALVATGYQSPDKLAKWLQEDESFVLCPDAHGGIEAGMHGDVGPNGSRGSANSFAKMGRRANIGHSHTSRIVDGVFQSGTSGNLTPDWTHGPSAWSWSHIITYEGGKRSIVTMWNGAWKA